MISFYLFIFLFVSLAFYWWFQQWIWRDTQKPLLTIFNNIISIWWYWYNASFAWWYSRAMVLKPVLGTPNHSILCMSLSFNTPDSTHQLISGVCKTWNGCGLWERHTKCVVPGGPQDRFKNHCSRELCASRIEKGPVQIVAIKLEAHNSLE